MRQKITSSLIILAALLLLPCIAEAKGKPKTWLVCVGISDYPDKKNKLEWPVRDAAIIKWVYEQNGNVETRMFLDKDATHENIAKGVKQLYAKAKKNDAVVFFYSGHGMPGSFDCINGYLKYDAIIDAMGASQAQRKIIFANSCFSGNLINKAGEKDQKQNTGDKKKQKNAKTSKNKGVMIFMSSRPNETSLGIRGMVHSVFPSYLQNALKGGADVNGDRTITAKELFDFVSQGVIKQTEDRQHPTMQGNFDDNMIILSW